MSSQQFALLYIQNSTFEKYKKTFQMPQDLVIGFDWQGATTGPPDYPKLEQY